MTLTSTTTNLNTVSILQPVSNTKIVSVLMTGPFQSLDIQYLDNKIHILPKNGRGHVVKNCGFELPTDPTVLRSLGEALMSLSSHLETVEHQNTIDYEQLLTDIEKALYSIEHCHEVKGEYYFYDHKDEYASPNYNSFNEALIAATTDKNLTKTERKKSRV